MKNITGPPVQNENFFGRRKELDFVWSKISDGNNYILPSPRRVGKTSFALKLIGVAQSNEWKTIHINLEKFNELEAMEELTKQVISLSKKESLLEKGRNLLDQISKLKPSATLGGVDVTINWAYQQKEIYSRLNELIDHSEPTLIFLDELAVLLGKMVKHEDGSERISDFLHWLRGVRITPSSNIRWIYCSSVGIENFASTHGVSLTLNDFSNHHLRSFDQSTSHEMLRTLANNAKIDFPDEVITRIIEKLDDCIPFFLQIVFSQLNDIHAITDKPITVELVEEAYNNLLDGSDFNTWSERLPEQYGELNKLAFLLLRNICQEHKGTSRNALLNIISSQISEPEEAEQKLSQLLYMLRNDGYLSKDNGKYLFRSPLLRDFWFKRFVQ